MVLACFVALLYRSRHEHRCRDSRTAAVRSLLRLVREHPSHIQQLSASELGMLIRTDKGVIEAILGDDSEVEAFVQQCKRELEACTSGNLKVSGAVCSAVSAID